jgi:hypothetical protein
MSSPESSPSTPEAATEKSRPASAISTIGNTAKAVLFCFNIYASQTKHDKIEDRPDVATKAQEQGLYHITSAADKILESGHVRATGAYDSYGLRGRSFFFAGAPTYNEAVKNLDSSLAPVVEAVKFTPGQADLDGLDVRQQDGAVSRIGSTQLNETATKVRLGLFADENDNLAYRELSPDEKYEVSERVKSLKSMGKNALRLDSLIQGLKFYQDMKQRKKEAARQSAPEEDK